MANDSTGSLKLVDRLQLAREIAKLVRARLPLEKALSHLAANSHSTLSQSIEAVNQRLQSGQSLAESFAQGTDPPTRMLAASIQLGESSNALDQALDYWASYHVTQQRLLRSLSSALVYPLLLVLVALTSILYSAWKLLPQYQQAFTQLAEVRPQWLGALDFIERYFGLIALAVIAGVLLVLWRSLGNRHGLDRLGLPRNSALRYSFYSQFAYMSALAVRSGQPVHAWLSSVMQSMGLTLNDNPDELLNSPECSQLVGQETSGVLIGLQTGQLSAADSESLLQTIGANAAVQAELECERLVHRLPMITSIVVGASAVATYLGLIYLPWIALFYCIARQA